MDATTTIEIETTNPANNFYIDKVYSYGDIVIISLLIVLVGLIFWKIIDDLPEKK